MQRMRGKYSFDEISAKVFLGLGINPYGNVWYVDSATGTSGKSGKSWSQAKATIAQAVALAVAGDIIAIRGSFSEAVTCSLAGVSFIGCGTGPVEATWTAPTVAGSWCLKLAAANCFVYNIKFKPVIYVTSGIPSAIQLATGSDYAVIQNCRFQGQPDSYKAIYASANLSNIKILDCEFLYMNTLTNGCAIYSASLAGAWHIKRNTFNSCLADIAIIGRMCELADNVHQIVGLAAAGTFPSTVTVRAIDLSGTNSGDNVMTRCTLGGTYNLATYTPASGDVWMGNFASIVATTAPNGLTVLIPAA